MNNDDRAKIYVDLWKSENSVKTGKLMSYFAVQTLIALGATRQTAVPYSVYFFSALGILSSVWWVFCIGRTVGFQKLWKDKATNATDADLFPTDADKAALRWYSKVPSRLIVLAPPIAGALIWLIVLVFSVGLGVASRAAILP